MASIGGAAGLCLPSHLTSSRSRRRTSVSAVVPRSNTTTASSSSIKCELSSPSHRNPKPSNRTPSKPLSAVAKTLAFSAAAADLFLHLSPVTRLGSGGPLGGGGNGGGGGGGGGGSGCGDGGDCWSRFLAQPAIEKDGVDDSEQPQSEEWDSHGLPANIVVQLMKLSGFKKYKVSEIVFFDRRRWANVGSDDSFFEMVSLRSGGVYTKAQLQTFMYWDHFSF